MKRFLAAMTLGMVLVVGTVSVQAADICNNEWNSNYI